MIIIFGSTGDLTKRKLIPALYNLLNKGILNENTPLVCVGRRNFTKEQFIEFLNYKEFISYINQNTIKKFLKLINYFPLNIESEDLSDFSAYINDIERKYNCSNGKIFYLALPSDLFKRITDIIRLSKLFDDGELKKIVFEKPFGYDLLSARNLNKYISSIFKEQEIYRIDHYLGKELIQNILTFRFSNIIFNEIWNNKFIEHVQITIAETIGVETRGVYYDKSGAVRDMVQNHILQVLSLIAMEPPISMNSEDIIREKIKVLKVLKEIDPEDLVIGQYDVGYIDGKKVLPYNKEPKVPAESKTETFAALKVRLNNNRWFGVPFYLRTGKRLAKRFSEVNIIFKNLPCNFFEAKELIQKPNLIKIRIQPDEGISVTFNIKYPGYDLKLYPVEMDFCHKCKFEINTPEAYELLLHHILMGDKTLFTSWEEVEESWKFIDKVIDIIKNKDKDFPNYSAGSFGPAESDELLKKDGREWISPSTIEHNRRQ